VHDAQGIFSENVSMLEGSGDLSKEVADKFVEALRELEEDRNVEASIEIYTEDCEVGNVAVPRDLRRPRRLTRVLDEPP
jgi:hypothetical protein